MIPCKVEGIYYNKTSIGTAYHAYGKAKFFKFNTFEECYEKAKEIAEKNKTYTWDTSSRLTVGNETVTFRPFFTKFPIYYNYSIDSLEGLDDYYGAYEQPGSVTKFTNQYDEGSFIRGNAMFSKVGDIIETSN